MSNNTLNSRYNIPYGSIWKHKDRGDYKASSIEHSFKDGKIPIMLIGGSKKSIENLFRCKDK
jgi:hypothetical protein